MSPLLTTRDTDGARWITMNDGKVNAMSPDMLRALHADLERAAQDQSPLVITGHGEIFSAGFDLPTLRGGGRDAVAMLEAGARLVVRLLSFPAPLVAVVNGHAMAMGAFTALGADVRIGVADAPARIAANEVAIGLTMPRFATALLRHRLTPAAFDLAAVAALPFSGAQAVAAGWFNELAPRDKLAGLAGERIAQLAALPREAHAATKLRVRAQVLAELEAGIEADRADWARRIGSGR